MFREPSPDGHTRVAGVVRPLHRRLPVRPDTRVLLRRLEVRVQTDRLQREQVAHSRRRMEPHVLQLQRNHPDRVSGDGRAENGFSRESVSFTRIENVFFKLTAEACMFETRDLIFFYTRAKSTAASEFSETISVNFVVHVAVLFKSNTNLNIYVIYIHM